jgi:hypothetical protein
LPSFRHGDACLPGFGLAGLQDALRHRLPFKEVGVPSKLLGGKYVLRERMQVITLKRHKARALKRDERLAGFDPVASRDRQSIDHTGHGGAHDPQLRRGDNNLGRIGQSLVGSARDGMYDANAQGLRLRRTNLHLILGQRHGCGANQSERKRGSNQTPP